MDENYKDGNEILHKRILEEKTPSPQSDESTETPDNDSDNAFPLFLSFKANDPITSVSEGIFEKYTNKLESDMSDKLQADSPFNQDEYNLEAGGGSAASEFTETEYLSQVKNHFITGDISDSFNKPSDPSVVKPVSMEIPVFKPYESKYEESQEPSYDIPQVFTSKTADHNSDGPYNPVRNQSYDTEIHSVESYEVEDHNPVSRSKSTRPILPGASTARPGTRYSAAQQMGNIVPLSNREKNTRRPKVRGVKPQVFVLLSVLSIIAAVVIWNTIDPNHPVTDFLGLTPDVTLSSEISTPSVSAAETAADVAEKPSETAAAAVDTTAKETTKQTTAATTKETTAATTAETAVETTAVETTAPTTGDTPAMSPSGFSTYISGGKSDGDTATFNIVFKNQGNSDVSFYDGIEYITVTFATSSIKITEVASDEFTFSADPDKSNTFIGIPVDKEVIAVSDSKTVAVSAKSAGASIGKYSIKYYVKGYT